MTDNADLFADTTTNDVAPNDPDHDFVQDLVGDGKKFKDVNTLAKSVLHKDMHISQIERENAELRQRVQQSLTLEEFYDKIKVPAPSPSSPQPQPQGEPERKEEVSLEQIGSLVDKRVQEHLSVEKQKANLNFTATEVQKRLGPGYQVLLKERAKQLGETEQALTQLAMTKPHVFLELMAPQTGGNVHIPGSPHTEVDSMKSNVNPSKQRTMKFYKELKQKDPAAYKDRRTQVQMHKDALALGEKFFDI